MNRPQVSRRHMAPARRHVVQQLNKALDLEELVVLPRPTISGRAASGLTESLQLQTLVLRSTRGKSKSMSSLRSIMAEFIADNIEAVPLQVLVQYNWDQVQIIWDEIVKKMLDSIEVFAKFTMAFPKEMHAKKVIHSSLENLAGMIGRINMVTISYISYRKQLAMRAFPPWALHLDLSQVPVAHDILLQLGAVPGLSVLKVSDTGLTNEMINHWARSESVTGFSQLKLLDIRKNSRTLHDLPRALMALVRFKALQIIRCDKLSSDSLDSDPEHEEEQRERWERIPIQDHVSIELVAHLGSKADRRPLYEATEDMFVDVACSRKSLSSIELPVKPTSIDTLAERKRKKQRKLLNGENDLWKNGF